MISISPIILSDTGHVDLLNDTAWTQRDGDPKRSLELSTEALELARTLGYASGEMRSLRNIGIGHFLLGDYETALPFLGAGLEAARNLGDKVLEGSCLNGLGIAYHRLGVFDSALEHLHTLIDLMQCLGDTRGQAIALTNIGLICDELGDHEDALKHHRESFEKMRQIGEFYSTAMINQGVVHSHQGRYEAALPYYLEALRAVREAGNRLDEARLLCNLGDAQGRLGRFEISFAYLHEALRLSRQLGASLQETQTLLALGEAHYRSGDHELARQHLEAALDVAERIGQRRFTQTIHDSLARVFEASDQITAAFTHFKHARRLETDLYRSESERRSRLWLARLELARTWHETEIQRLRNAALSKANEVLTGTNTKLRAALHASGRDPQVAFRQATVPECPLSPRELEVLNLVALGQNNREIGARLGISASTARYHISSILGKLLVVSRTQAVAIGMRQGWLLE